jgi:hypothetical protein
MTIEVNRRYLLHFNGVTLLTIQRDGAKRSHFAFPPRV